MSLEYIPTGRSRELKAQKETLPAVEVENEVIWVNPNLEIPFGLKEGESTDLGIFLDDQNMSFKSSSGVLEGTRKVEVAPDHNRSALLGRVVFGEKKREGFPRRLYRDVVLKGLGYVLDSLNAGKVGVRNKYGSYGILDLKYAEEEREHSEAFGRLGVRTPRVVAIISLKEIVSGGERISIKKAKKNKLLLEDAEPVLEIQAFGTEARIKDILTNNNKTDRKDLLVDDARILVAQELSRDPGQFPMSEYATWLAKTIGRNLGLMHKHGYVHWGLLTGHNITLDGCFLDFDMVTKSDSTKEFSSEKTGVSRLLYKLLLELNLNHDGLDDLTGNVFRAYEDSYQESMGDN